MDYTDIIVDDVPAAVRQADQKQSPWDIPWPYNITPEKSPPSQEYLRNLAWEIGEGGGAEVHCPRVNHTALAMVTPGKAFAHWHIYQEWIDKTAAEKGELWRNCRLILRLYDVSFIEFNGFNAHHFHDYTLPAVSGRMIFDMHRVGTWELAEVGFVLQNGEFVAAARSNVVQFSRINSADWCDPAGLLIHEDGRREDVGNVWEQDRILWEKRQPQLRKPLRIAAFSFLPPDPGQENGPTRFITELAFGKRDQGHEMHVFVPAQDHAGADFEKDGIHYHPLRIHWEGSPVVVARSFGHAAN